MYKYKKFEKKESNIARVGLIDKEMQLLFEVFSSERTQYLIPIWVNSLKKHYSNCNDTNTSIKINKLPNVNVVVQ